MPSPMIEPVHISRLKHIARSPAHYRYALDHPPTSKTLTFGSAVHSLVLGGKSVVPYSDRRAGKEWEAFAGAHHDAYILSDKDYARADAMATAVLLDPLAASWLNWGSHEVKIDWETCGRACQSTLDVLGHDFVCDLKTTRSSDPNRFQWDARRMGYAAQLAFYCDAASFKTGRTFERAYIIAVESEPPHVVTPFEITPRLLEQGRQQCRAWLERLLSCEASNEWPGYAQHVVQLDIQEDEESLGLIVEDEDGE